jgi:hypothetical protein
MRYRRASSKKYLQYEKHNLDSAFVRVRGGIWANPENCRYSIHGNRTRTHSERVRLFMGNRYRPTGFVRLLWGRLEFGRGAHPKYIRLFGADVHTWQGAKFVCGERLRFAVLLSVVGLAALERRRRGVV